MGVVLKEHLEDNVWTIRHQQAWYPMLPLSDFVLQQTEVLLWDMAALTANSTFSGLFHTCPVDGHGSQPILYLWNHSCPSIWNWSLQGTQLELTSPPSGIQRHLFSLGQASFYCQDTSFRDNFQILSASIKCTTLAYRGPSPMCQALGEPRDEGWADRPPCHSQ